MINSCCCANLPYAAGPGAEAGALHGHRDDLVEQFGAGPALRFGRCRAALRRAHWPNAVSPGRGRDLGPSMPRRSAGRQMSPARKFHRLVRTASCGAWAARYGSVAVALRGDRAAAAETAWQGGWPTACMRPDTPLAQAHGTRYPIVQGPMTHVSDRVDFIEAVAAGGALPMVAVSLMRGEAAAQAAARHARQAGRPAVGRRHPRLRAGRRS